MASIVVLCRDLLFGSKVEGGLGAAGHEVRRVDDEAAAREAARGCDALVVDLTDDGFDGPALVDSMRREELAGRLPILGFYAHVDVDARRRAEAAGFDLVVPRSRMAREMAVLVEGLVGRSGT